jgi:RNA polymerase sigma factor (sigma-70 family)
MESVEDEVLDDAAVYQRHASELISFAAGLVGRGEAADVVSSAMVRVLGAPGWASVGNRRAYLFRAVFNEAVSWGRRSRRRVDVERTAASRDRLEFPTLRPDVRLAVERLSVRQRAVVLLTYWADLDPVTVADHLGLSEGTVRRHLARARARLRKVLDE